MTHTRHERAAGAGRRCVSYVTLGRGDFEPTAALGKGATKGTPQGATGNRATFFSTCGACAPADALNASESVAMPRNLPVNDMFSSLSERSSWRDLRFIENRRQ